MKAITTTIICILLLVQCFAQSLSNGTYSTNYGTVKFVTETGTEYPDGGIIYGDYKDNGTITGTFKNNATEVEGRFHNGASEGQFVFFPKGGANFFQQITGFYGNWGYQSNNKYSTSSDHKWDGTKTSNTTPSDFTINVWSGKWNTSQGFLILQQVGNKVTGKYHTVGDITATYNPSTKKLTGTFTNNGKQGYLEYIFEGNSFKGKWGWTSALTGGDWTGTKHVKTNKAVSTTATSSSTTTAVTQTATTTTSSTQLQNEAKEKFRINIVQISVDAIDLPIAAATQYWWFYGFSGVRVYKVTNSGRAEIRSFGNKSQNFFDKTEDNPLNNNSKTPFIFSNTPDYYRDFEISKADLINPDVAIEVEYWHHIKVKVAGPNKDYGKVRKTLNLKEVVNKGAVNVCENCSNNVRVSFKIDKL